MKREKIYIFCILLLVAFLPLGGCITDDLSADSCQVPVRILTTISPGMGDTGTRAAGTVSDDPNNPYKEYPEDGDVYESAVGTVRVLAFKAGSTAKNILYRKTGETLAAGEKNFLYESGIFKMDMEILPGDYEFVIVANEETSWNLSSVATRANLAQSAALNGFSNNIITSVELKAKVDANSGIPMLGFRPLSIVAKAGATEANPFEITPSIDLKRTLAKVEVSLTNVEDPVTNKVFVKATNYTIKSVELVNSNRVYNIFEESTAPVTETAVTGLINTITHTAGQPFTQKVLWNYMAERKNVSGETNATNIVIKVDRSGEEVTYTIPLYQNINGEKNYDIVRNTLYRIKASLNGSEMPFVEIYYSTGDWEWVQKSLFMGYGYTIEMDGDNITIKNTVEACKPHEIVLTTSNGAKFLDGSTSKTFGSQTAETHKDYAITASADYTLTSVPASGPYLEVRYNGTLVKTYSK